MRMRPKRKAGLKNRHHSHRLKRKKRMIRSNNKRR